jgi:hypothetical protein
MVGEAMLKMFPDLWKMICGSKKAIEIMEPHVGRFGVRFDYGCA